MAPGEIRTVTGTYTVSLSKDAGNWLNESTVKGLSPQDVPVNSVYTVTVLIPETPVIGTLKSGILSTDPNSIAYSFKVTNKGDVTLHGVTLTIRN